MSGLHADSFRHFVRRKCRAGRAADRKKADWRGDQSAEERTRHRNGCCVIIPGDAAVPGVDGWRQEDETDNPFGMTHGKGRCDRAAKGVADNDRLRNPAPCHKTCDGVRLSVRQYVFRSADIRAAMSRPIDEQKCRSSFELPAKGIHRVVKTGAGTVDENDRWQARLLAGFKKYAVQTEAADIDANRPRLVRDRPERLENGPDQNQQA